MTCITKELELPSLPEGFDQRIEIISKISQLLCVNDISFSSISSEIDGLSDEDLSLKLSNNRLEFIERELASSLALASHELQLILKWKEELEEGLTSSETPASLERKREALIRKAKELHKEHEEIMGGLKDKPSITIAQLLKQKEKNAKKEEDIKMKKAKLKAFQGLPPNFDLARHELFQAQQEQMKLIQLRERLLASMADSIS